jgi:tRNA(fMet)-specific endonuclease VapC
MDMTKVLIDTNIYSLAMKGETGVVGILRKIERIGISTISLGELYSGFKAGPKEKKNRQELETFLNSPRVVLHSVDAETADFYAFILNNLKQAGTPIPTNDIWIAACAMQHGYKLFSRDKHFGYVQGILCLWE